MADGRTFLDRRIEPTSTLAAQASRGIAAAYRVTFTVGMAVFPGQWAWWGPGAVVAALLWRAGSQQ